MGEALKLKGVEALVVGLASTGLETANALAARGARVTVSEARASTDVEIDLSRLDSSVATEFGGHSPEAFARAKLVVPSPGVPRDLPQLVEARVRGIPVMSEIELASRLIRKPILAVTGTNGKSTTVSLLGAMLAEGGYRAPVVGNIGTPLITMAGRDAECDCLVVEVSSFQLEWVTSFRPRSAAILNVTDDHLDRYRGFDDYLATKLAIAARQGPGDCLVLNWDDPSLHGTSARSRVIWFSHGSLPRGVFERNGTIVFSLDNGEPVHLLETRNLSLVGVHNVENVMAAAALALDFGVEPAAVRRAAVVFTGLPHRNEPVGEVDGVRYYDDSKATNVGAVKKSLESFRGPVILIAGGRDKGGSYGPLADEVSRKVKLLVLIGEGRKRIAQELGCLTRTLEAGSMEEAVESAHAQAEPGDVVLLSPACSSFDMFKDYKARGEAFREAVRKLACPAT